MEIDLLRVFLFPVDIHSALSLGSSSFSLSRERRETNDGRAEFQRSAAESGAAPQPGFIQGTVGERVSLQFGVS